MKVIKGTIVLLAKKMKTYLITALFLVLQPTLANAQRINPNVIRTVVTAIATGASAAAFGETGVKEELREAYREQGIDPAISATFDIEIFLEQNADALKWADNLGSADLFFVMQSGSKRSLAPFKYDGFKGGNIAMQLQGNIVQPKQQFSLQLYDDDTLWGDVFTALVPKKISARAGLMTEVLEQDATLEGTITCELQGGRIEINDPDYIGAITFDSPNHKQWTVSGNIVDQWKRKIGTFSITQHPMDGLGVLHSAVARFIGFGGAAIALLVGIPLLVSKTRNSQNAKSKKAGQEMLKKPFN